MRIKTSLALTLSDISNVLDVPINEDAEINAITTDSRLCEKSDLFIAIPGENTDGRNYIDQAFFSGAFVVADSDKATFKVDDAKNALLKIAAYYKEKIKPAYTVAVTGSVGKTTTKDFIATLISAVMPTHKTKDNYNNILGLSYTLLSMPTNTRALVCELGMNHKDEINVLSRALKPDVSLITNIGTAHIGNLGSKKAIAEAKLEIQNGMNGGKIIVFKEEELLKEAQNPFFISRICEEADIFFTELCRSENGSEIFVKTKNYEKIFTTNLNSSHTIDSLMLAVAVCSVIGIPENDIANGIKNISRESLRQKFLTFNGYTIFDDSYNSSPEAVIADLKMLSEQNLNISALIGDMLELGCESKKLHRCIGAQCAKYSVKKLYAFGKYADEVAKGAYFAGMKKKDIFVNKDLSHPKRTAMHIRKSYEGETILVKGSHNVNLDRIIQLLKRKENEALD